MSRKINLLIFIEQLCAVQSIGRLTVNFFSITFPAVFKIKWKAIINYAENVRKFLFKFHFDYTKFYDFSFLESIQLAALSVELINEMVHFSLKVNCYLMSYACLFSEIFRLKINFTLNKNKLCEKSVICEM